VRVCVCFNGITRAIRDSADAETGNKFLLPPGTSGTSPVRRLGISHRRRLQRRNER